MDLRTGAERSPKPYEDPTARPPAADETAGTLRFDAFEFDLRRGELRRSDGTPIPLRPKTDALLRLFLAQPGRLLCKDELMQAIWPAAVVTDDSLVQCVGDLRHALGGADQRLIRTVLRRGYRLECEVRSKLRAATEEPDSGATDPVRPSRVDQAVTAAAVRRPPWHWPKRSTLTATALLLALTVATGAALISGTGSRPALDTAIAAERSLAVMPFGDLSSPPAPHVAEAVMQEIVTDLAHVPDALVVVSGSVPPEIGAAPTDAVRVGRQWKVGHVLSGAVRQDGDRVEVSVSLVRAADGALIWSSRFEGVRGDWPWVHDVSRLVAASLQFRLDEAIVEQARREARNDTAMEQWMRGEYLLRHINTRDDLMAARRHLEAALATDPRSLHALSALAVTHFREANFRWSADRKHSLSTAKDLARRALAIDPNHAVALSALGNALAFNGEFEAALPVIEHELKVAPNSATAHRDKASLLYFIGRFEELEPHAEMALRLGPLEPFNVGINHTILGFARLHQHRDEEAYDEFQRSALAAPVLVGGRYGLISAAALTGRLDEAHRLLDEARSTRPELTIAKLQSNRNSNHPEYAKGHARYFDGLRLAGLPEGVPAKVVVTALGPQQLTK